MSDIRKVEKLYFLYEQPMYRIAYAILKNEWQAEDAVSDAFEKIILNLNKIGHPQSTKTRNYVISVIKSVAIDQYRRNCKNNECVTTYDDEIENNHENVVADEEGSINREMVELIREKVSSDFTDEEKVLFDLRFIQEKSYKEIAGDYNIGEGCARKRVERLRKKIKEVCYVQY